MSRLSLLLAALLLAVFATAQWSDVLYTWWTYVNVTKLCAIDNPDACVYIPRIAVNSTDAREMLIFIGDDDMMRIPYNPADYVALQFVVDQNPLFSVNVYVPADAYLFVRSDDAYWGRFNVDDVAAEWTTICNRSGYAAHVSKGWHKVWSWDEVPLPLYMVSPGECVFYRLGAYISNIFSAPGPGKTVAYIFYMPTAAGWRYAVLRPYYYFGYYVLDGASHIYVVAGPFLALSPAGSGIYIADGRAATVVVYEEDVSNPVGPVWYPYGPVSRDKLDKAVYSYPDEREGEYRIFSMGPSPSDGVVYIILPETYNVTVAYIAEGTAGQVKIMPRYAQSRATKFYVQRYSLVEVAVETAQGVLYAARTLACPVYGHRTADEVVLDSNALMTKLARLDNAKEIEICNNNTSTFYIALYSTQGYLFVDRVDADACRRFRWDSSISNTYTRLLIFRNASDVCEGRVVAAIPGGNYTAGWRYYLVGDRLVRGPPIDPDDFYAELWRKIIQELIRLYNATAVAVNQWLKQQKSLHDFFASQPRVVGTIRVSSSTSTWLKTTLSELQKWQVVAPSASFGAVSLPQVPAAVAPAAAAAVAVAWAASRRDDDVAAAAAVAGIALALFGILMTVVYGTSSLTLVALGIIVAAAAAAWKKI